MLPTRSLVVLFLAGLLLQLSTLCYVVVHATLVGWFPDLAAWAPEPSLAGYALLAVLGFDGWLFALFLLDAWLARWGFQVRVRRDRPARLSLGVNNEITLVVENRSRRRQRLIIRDEPPVLFLADPGLLNVTVPAHVAARCAYQLLPSQRGNFQFGDVHCRCRGPFGLAWVDRKVAAAENVQVYPNLLEVRRYEALVRTTLMRTAGYRMKRLPGAGREFSHYRDYTPDDDYRTVSWKATARRGKPITAVHESELSQDIILCLDVGRMMATRVGTLTKLDHAINAILMLTHVSQTFQDNVGLLIFSHKVHRYLPPAKGRSQHAHFLQALYSVQPELCYVNYQEAFQYLVGRHPKRALTMVFTDLLDAVVSSGFRDACTFLRRFHLPLTLAVADVPLQQLGATTPATTAEMYDILVARDLLQGRAELLRQLERQGVLVLDTVPENLTVDAVNRYLGLKMGAGM
jgi:uncharacterized protein (DUF58 family)